MMQPRDDSEGSYAALTSEAAEKPVACEDLEDPVPCMKERCTSQKTSTYCDALPECAWGETSKSKNQKVCSYVGQPKTPEPVITDPNALPEPQQPSALPPDVEKPVQTESAY